ncbi:MAG: molybdenum ABC transporter ATP-binding protein [Planctomycetota bacterium]
MTSTGAVQLLVDCRVARGGFELNASFAAAGGWTALFGASGAGKTTLLRCIAGLEPECRGRIRFGDSVWLDSSSGQGLPARRRGLGFVFQEPSLFPHLDVAANLDFGWRRTPRRRRRVSREEVVEWLGLGPLLPRRPRDLSGGEGKRVALGRALLASPRLLLLDEPLAGLDDASRRSIMGMLEQLQSRLGLTALLVTHTVGEVARLADRVVWLDRGSVRCVGAVEDVLSSSDLLGAHGEGAAAVLAGTVAAHDEAFALSELRTAAGNVWVGRVRRPLGARVRVMVAARDVSLALREPRDSSILNVFAGTVVSIEPAGGAQAIVRLRCGDGASTTLVARITEKSRVRLGLSPGARVFAGVKSVSLMDE